MGTRRVVSSHREAAFGSAFHSAETGLFSCAIVPVADNLLVVITSEHTDRVGVFGAVGRPDQPTEFGHQAPAAASEAKAPELR